MKKLIALICFVFITGVLFGQNMLSNPGFENWTVHGSGGPPDDWSLSGGSMTAEQETTNVHGGTYSAKITWTTTSTRYLQQLAIPVTSGSNYQFTFWVLDNDPDGRARVAIRWYDSNGDLLSGYYGGYSSDSPNWQQLDSGLQEAPTNADSAHAEIRIYDVSWDGDATVYVDDASFTLSTTNAIVDAYSLSDDQVEVFYADDLSSVDPADYELTGTATITFSNATIDGSDAKLVHLSGASSTIVGDNTLDTISDEAKSTYELYAGIIPISYTNANNPSGTIDGTHFATFKGIVSANDGYNNVWVSDAAGAYNGVLIYDYSFDGLVSVGDEILFRAIRDVYDNLSELKDPELINTISTGNDPYGPTVITCADLDENYGPDENPAEQWEGQLVKIENYYVDSYTDYDYRCRCNTKSFVYFHIGDNVDYHFYNFSLLVGANYLDIIGVVDWDYDENYYRVNPRTQGDATLPVELASFTASFMNDYTLIEWTTATETDVQGFNVYRNNENDFGSAIQLNQSLIPGHGTSSIPHSYEFEDLDYLDFGTTYYYWLESVDLSYNIELYGAIEYIPEDGQGGFENEFETNLLKNYPNPCQENTTIEYGIKGMLIVEPIEINIYNIAGQLIKTIEAQNGTCNLDTSELTPGVYFYQLKTDNFNEVKKMVIFD